MIYFILGLSITFNLLTIAVVLFILANRKKFNNIKNEVLDIEAFKDFYNSNNIDF